MKRGLRFGQAHVALTALGVAFGAGAVLRVRVPLPLAVLVALGAWTVYVAERLACAAPEDARNHPERTRWFAANRRRLAGGVALALAACTLAWARLPLSAQGLAVGVAALGAVYLLPAVRRSALAKTALVALGWGTGGALLLPLADGRPVDAAALALAASVALLVAANALLLDALDADGDRAAGRATFAARQPVPLTGPLPIPLTGPRYRALLGAVLLASALALGAAVRLGGASSSVGLVALVPHAVLALAAARGARLRAGDALWLDLAVGAGGLAALLR